MFGIGHGACNRGLSKRLSGNLTQHSTLFPGTMAEKLGEIPHHQRAASCHSQDINQLSHILESPKLRGNVGSSSWNGC